MDELLKKIADNKKRLQKLLSVKENKNTLYNWLKNELAYTSNAIEGNTLTRRETALAIEENITTASKPVKDYMEAVNHAKAFDFIWDYAKSNAEITEATILQIHKIILAGIDNNNAGFYRNVRVRISGSQTVLPNPLKVPDLMAEFINWLKHTKDIDEIKAIEAHYRLVSIHPFIDGNGRTSRLLMNLILLTAGLSPIIIRPIDRKRYLTALEERQVKEKSEAYIKFMLTALNRSLKTAIDLLDVEKEDVNKQDLLTVAKFAKLCGIPTSTIRYWVQTKKITPVAYTESGYMLFSKDQKSNLNL